MDVPALLSLALEAVDGNQAELARRLGRSETTVSRWISRRNGIDFESALRLSRITGLPPRDVVEIVGLDPDLVPGEASAAGRDPEWTQFLAELEAAWHQADDIERSLAKRGTLALWGAVPSVARPAIGKRRRAAIGPGGQVRQLDGSDRTPTENGSGTSLAEWYSDGRASLLGFLRQIYVPAFAFR